MNIEQFTDGDERFARQYRYEDESVVAIDLGSDFADGSVDVVGETVIVVPSGDAEQVEIDVSTEDAQAFINNGVLTIELEE